ncbi:unnamed protein product [Pleuronectes platessa]|uniref:Uncharacterized protein n=1 Tax=Pleuronectes platessa TaxID=8262 RepID=A0A9N7VPV8_PLEPL|nr:unnamed protein product [Pleuronectes platessa]
MDEYDKLFEIQDEFEDQFADELEVLAQMEDEAPKADGHQTRAKGENISVIMHLLGEEPTTPQAKRQKQEQGVIKRLFSKSPTQGVTSQNAVAGRVHQCDALVRESGLPPTERRIRDKGSGNQSGTKLPGSTGLKGQLQDLEAESKSSYREAPSAGCVEISAPHRAAGQQCERWAC